MTLTLPSWLEHPHAPREQPKTKRGARKHVRRVLPHHRWVWYWEDWEGGMAATGRLGMMESLFNDGWMKR